MRMLFFVLVATGCSASAMTRDDAVRPNDTSDQPRAELVGPFTKLGASCGTELPTGAAFTCGEGHRIASLTVPFQKMPNGVVRHRKPVLDRPVIEHTTTQIMIDGTHIWMESSCSMCRMMMFSTTVVDLQLIADSDLSKAQTDAGLPSAPLLRTPKAWAEATASWDRFTLPYGG